MRKPWVIRAVTGYLTHAALLAYWLCVVASTAPQLRKGTRDRRVRGAAPPTLTRRARTLGLRA